MDTTGQHWSWLRTWSDFTISTQNDSRSKLNAIFLNTSVGFPINFLFTTFSFKKLNFFLSIRAVKNLKKQIYKHQIFCYACFNPKAIFLKKIYIHIPSAAHKRAIKRKVFFCFSFVSCEVYVSPSVLFKRREKTSNTSRWLIQFSNSSEHKKNNYISMLYTFWHSIPYLFCFCGGAI